ncbi:aminotransferase class I/II-fold pyridoxal phosphate-dependent enzyme [Roseivirga sp. BDSF3-8]|uniref:aminotransferase class I/II-fold pyridoxal phosphate-dependent enzyme n=1 Tax=Roseivirga sp. BDSF3-8 TaxID=3241598 RepID=UPI0035327746
MLIEQDYSMYTEEDHSTWASLVNRHLTENLSLTSKEYQNGFDLLRLEGNDKVANIPSLSEKLKEVSGWKLIPVTGLIPTKDFFYQLINKEYPVTVYCRKPEELDFSELPDIFHDIYGHIPLLTNEKFFRFLTKFSILALKYAEDPMAVEFLGRLYWYTFEMGVIWEGGELKPYGGAIVTSKTEIENLNSKETSIYPFDIHHILNTPYNPYALQSQYFAVRSFDELFYSLEDLEEQLIKNLVYTSQTSQVPEHHNIKLNTALSTNFKNVIGFLNDIQFKFPKAVSLAAGQPDESYFKIDEINEYFESYIDYLESKSNQSRDKIANSVGQYAKTQGIINEILCEFLRKDENITVKEHQVIVTVGAQEAFAVITATLCNREEDVILMEDPTYIGLGSFSKTFDYETDYVGTSDTGIDLEALEEKILAHRERKKNVKLVYVIPDHQNPSGASMPVDKRLSLLRLAEKYNFYIIEDSVYNSFTYLDKTLPTLKSLDKFRRVLFVTSFSKSVFPGLRVGLVVADQQVMGTDGNVISLAHEMVKVKASLTNSTPTITQAILGGLLLRQDYSLSKYNYEKLQSYRNKLNTTLECLDKYIGSFTSTWASDISWNRPKGGFFLSLKVPFELSDAEVVKCAEDFEVIICPMAYFHQKGGGKNEIRLTFSNLTPQEIETAISRLAKYLEASIAVRSQGAKADAK